MLSLNTPSGFVFSGEQINNLGASEYTLAAVVCDESGSIGGQEREIEKMLKNVLGACQKSPRHDNLMLRASAFDNNVREVHGFKLLNTINEPDYDNAIQARGSTALCDATLESIEAIEGYAQKLADQEFLCNALVVVITDGYENASHRSNPNTIAQKIDSLRKSEALESIQLVLVGLSNGAASVLKNFSTDAGFDQFVDVGDATPQKLAKLGNFVSRSISSTSQALGTGGPSQSLTF